MLSVTQIPRAIVGRCGATHAVCAIVLGLAGTLSVSTGAAHAFGGVGLAQTNLPGTVTAPGRERQRTPQLTPDRDFRIELPGTQDAPAAVSGQTFMLKGIKIEGNTVYFPGVLELLYRDLIDTEITVGQLFELAERIGQHYFKDGYELAYAYLPPQAVEDGVFTVRVIEGYVDAVEVEGIEEPTRSKVQSLLEELIEQRPLNMNRMERKMLLANDLAGVDVQAILEPSRTKQGAATLIAKTEETNLAGLMSVDNRASKYIGKWNYTTEGSVKTVAGLGEKVTFRYTINPLATKELVAYGLDFEVPVGNDGLVAYAEVAYADSQPGYDLDEFDVESQSFGFNIGMRYPVIRSRDYNLALGAAFNYDDVEVDFLEEVKLVRDHVRALSFTANFRQATWLDSVSDLQIQLRQGLDGAFGGSHVEEQLLSRSDADPDFTKLTVDLIHLQPLYFDNLTLLAFLQGQYSLFGSELHATEEFGIGGSAIGRGYDAAEITGEHGLAGAFDLAYRFDLDHPELPWIEWVQPYGFYDIGYVLNRNERDGSQLGRQTLASAGIGLRMAFPYGLTGSFEWARPLTRTLATNERERKDRFFVNIIARQ